ncbi:hypothetical protein CU669_15130 [Paramagnetospirillum kuznetsovii]|uniref:Uncharacterized protein n=1 Tax=Paramagnetospirillum kuznetsovii TaxID=2053833 RepID=A0A364NVZ2_9PROT|nr:hypothetical protein [Paramagnetospirillum kuznetsovii]RAU21087.1 hypothetical protein CU669_15130 [Paramagnetospirillum kuznetsovii]
MALIYDYTAAKAYSDQLGLTWADAWLPAIDKTFADNGLTQAQVDVALREWSWRIKWIFTPSNYSKWQRIKLAAHFLFGRI